MKKITLLFILCASQLYGMEREHHILAGTWQNLPKEVKSLIVIAITQNNNNLNEAIKDIITFSRVNKELNNNLNDLQGFTKIVHILANKFNCVTQMIADKFKTLIAKKYINLGDDLIMHLASNHNIEKVIQCINEGADVNYSRIGGSFGYLEVTPLATAVKNINIDAVKLLLDSGANPYFKHSKEGTPLNYIQQKLIPIVKEQNNEEILKKLNSIKELLEKAMQNKQKQDNAYLNINE